MRAIPIYHRASRYVCRVVAGVGFAVAVRRRQAIGGCPAKPILIMTPTRIRSRSPFVPSAAFAALAAALLMLPGASRAAHPLVSDDTGTQGAGRWQFEASADRTRERDDGLVAREHEVAFTLTRGLSDTLDLAIGLPWLRLAASGAPTQRGAGDLKLLAKWRAFDNGQGLSLGLRPEITLPTGKEDKGLGNGRATASLTGMLQLEQGPWTWLANAGLVHNDNKAGDRKRLWTASTALLYAAADAWTLVADVGAARAAEPGAASGKFGLLGVIHHLGEDLDLDFGWRRSLGSGPRANTLGVGLTVRW